MKKTLRNLVLNRLFSLGAFFVTTSGTILIVIVLLTMEANNRIGIWTNILLVIHVMPIIGIISSIIYLAKINGKISMPIIGLVLNALWIAIDLVTLLAIFMTSRTM